MSAFLLLLIAAAPAQAQCDPDTRRDQCTIGQAYEFYRTPARAAEAAGEKVKDANRATEPPDPFAAQLHNSYQDFLNLLSFAINKVEEAEDGQALTIRFNPVRSGSDVFGATLTAARPGVSDLVKNALPAEGRADLVTRLEGQLGQTDDLTYSISWARQTVNCAVDRNPEARCWGRDPKTYRGLLSHAIAPLLARVDDPDTSELKIALTDPELVPDALRSAAQDQDVFNVRVSDAKNPNRVVQIVRELAAVQIEAALSNRNVFEGMRLADVAILIDNQPQMTSSVNYHDAGRYGGPPVLSASFELQFGNANLNAIRSACDGDQDCLKTELEKRLRTGISTMKWVITGSYAMNDDYDLIDLGKDVTIPTDFKPIHQKSFRAVTLKAQGGAQMPGEMLGQRMRADGSIEFERITTGDVEKRKNRFVAKATVTVPLGNKMSVPVSLTWANNEKFLGDQTDKLGMHLGISYRLPELFGKK
jgi:hypothetical protein